MFKHHRKDAFRSCVWDANNLRLAWRAVKRAKGAPGPDGIDVDAFQRELADNLLHIQSLLRRGAYRPGPVRTVKVPKNNGEMRELGIIDVKDRVAQRAMLNVLEPHFETRFLDCSFGFRPDRNVELAVKRVKRLHRWGCKWVVDGDIHRFFDSTDLDLLHRFVARDIPRGKIACMIHRCIDAYHKELQSLWCGLIRRPKGIIQGSVLSPLLSNIYLHRFDRIMTRYRKNLVRYADDFVVLSQTEKQAKADMKLVKQILAWLRLRPNTDKTAIVPYHSGFEFLGRRLGGGHIQVKARMTAVEGYEKPRIPSRPEKDLEAKVEQYPIENRRENRLVDGCEPALVGPVHSANKEVRYDDPLFD